jgi:murein DD-endopeptidase MepM/ murein hydrolase activator NlpD
MKVETVIIAIVLLLLAAFAFIGALQATIGEQQAKIAEQERQIAALEAEKAELQDQLRAPPYEKPLARAVVSSGCGYRMDPMGGGTEGLHKGVDLVGPVGAPVKAVLAGTVVEHWPAPDDYWHGHPVFGGFIVIDHGEGLFSLYGHLSDTYVHEGHQIKMGQVIGALGDTGIATGPHLHLEIVVDPLRYLEER